MIETKMLKKIKANNPAHKITGIESGSTELGIPDCFIQSNKGSLWVELKQKSKWPRGADTIKPRWRPGQIKWAEDHLNHGGKWCLIIVIGETWFYTPVPKKEYEQGDLHAFANLRGEWFFRRVMTK